MPSINQQLCTVFLYGRWFSHAIQRKHETKWLGCCWFIVFIWSIRSLMNSVIDDLKLCSWYIYRCAQMFCGIPCNLEPLYDMPHIMILISEFCHHISIIALASPLCFLNWVPHGKVRCASPCDRIRAGWLQAAVDSVPDQASEACGWSNCFLGWSYHIRHSSCK